jgi:predicted ATP-dependent serine protease
MEQETKRSRGRPKSLGVDNPEVIIPANFDVTTIVTKTGSELSFSDDIFIPMKTKSELDLILSTEGGVMPATNMVLVGGPGCGKSTVTLDMLSKLVNEGYKCLYISAEMDEIAYYKYCRRIPKLACVQVLFLNNYVNHLKPTLEYIFNEGYDVIAVDSIAEVIDSYKIHYRTTENAAEKWFLELQEKHKKGNNPKKYYTTFINIQQVTKAGDFVGSNRLKHMTDAMCHLERSKDGLERTMHFSKNRDCDKDFKIYFAITNNDVHYTCETEKVSSEE